MSRKDRLKVEISFLTEEYKGYFLVLIALLSGIAGLVYAVVSGDKPAYVLLLLIVGMLFLIVLLINIDRIKSKINQKLNEIEGE